MKKVCIQCGIEFEAQRDSKTTCSGKCRTAYHRREEQMRESYLKAVKDIGFIIDTMEERDDLTLIGDELLAKLSDVIASGRFGGAMLKIIRLQNERDNMQ